MYFLHKLKQNWEYASQTNKYFLLFRTLQHIICSVVRREGGRRLQRREAEIWLTHTCICAELFINCSTWDWSCARKCPKPDWHQTAPQVVCMAVWEDVNTTFNHVQVDSDTKSRHCSEENTQIVTMISMSWILCKNDGVSCENIAEYRVQSPDWTLQVLPKRAANPKIIWFVSLQGIDFRSHEGLNYLKWNIKGIFLF